MVYGSIAEILYQWEALGVFDFILPFLLVFAIVFGILSATNILGANRGVAVIIAFVVGLMSIRYQYFFSSFLSEIFPRLGIGLTILLMLLILVGLFIAKKEQKYWGYGLAAIGAIIAIVIFYQTAESLGWAWVGGYGSEGVGMIILGIFVVGIIVAIAASGGNKSHDGSAEWGPLRIGLRE
jgi:hypothetical protein